MLKSQKVYVVHEFDAPVAKVFATLSEPKNLSKIFYPAKFTPLSVGIDFCNGLGSTRKFSLPLIPSFIHTIMIFNENELIEYAITDGIAPVKDHRGVMKFTNIDGKRTRFEYTVTFKGRIPLIGLISKIIVENVITYGLQKLHF